MKKWFFVSHKIQNTRAAYCVYFTDAEMTELLKDPDKRSLEKGNTAIYELTETGKQKSRKDLLKGIW